MSEPTPEEIAAVEFGIHEQDPVPVAKPTRKRRAQAAPEFHREFPQAGDSERGVLAAILLSPEEVLDLCIEKGVMREAFYLPAHQELFEAFHDIRKAGKPVEFIIIGEHLRAKGRLEAIGGPAYLHELSNLLASAAYVSHHIADLLAKQTARRIIEFGTRVAERGYGLLDGEGLEELLGDVEKGALAIRSGEGTDDLRPIQPAVMQALANIDRRINSPGTISGISWGLRSVDLATDGLVASEFIVLAGLPGCGKTSLLRQTLTYVAENVGPVGVWNLEMGDEQLAEAWIFHLANVNPIELRHRQIWEDEHKRILDAAERLAKMPVHLTGSPGMSIQAFQASVRRAVKKKGIVVAAVDSATQVTSEGFGSRRWEQVNDLGPGFKSAAKENRIPVVVLWHLGSDFEKRIETDPLAIPKYRELEGGAGGSRNCDKFISLVARDFVGEENRRVQYHELCSSKQRMGEPNAKVALTFLGKYTRFIEPQPEEVAEQTVMQLP